MVDAARTLMLVLFLSTLVTGELDALTWKVNASLECPSECQCSKASTDPSLIKTDCSKRDYWFAPDGVSPGSTHVNFADNRIASITRKYLATIRKVVILNLARNRIEYLPKGLLSDLMDLEVLDLSGNNIEFIKEGVFNGLPKLSTLYLNENRISRLESGTFQGLPRLKHLWLFINQIWDLPHNIFHGLHQLKVLSVSMNKLTQLNAQLLNDAKNLEYLFLQHNEIKAIPDYLFKNTASLKNLFLNNNNLTEVGPNTFKGASGLETLTLSNNFELADLKSDSFNYNNFGNLSLIYILQTALVRIKMHSFKHHRKVGLVIAPTDNVYPFHVPGDDRLREGLARSGFTCVGVNCTPCHFGTYQRRLTNGSYICENCPAGGFYQNTIGHYGTLAGQTGCLPCPKGTYVELDKFPGKHQFVCRVCPAGSKTDEWASYRGCFCIDSFYRRGRFTRCEACPKGIRGILCNETILVKQGYWWKFRDYNESWEYQRFVDALMVPDEKFNHANVNFTGIFPKPYPCPKAASCLGLLNSVRKPCKTGYGGPLCEVCVKGYYKSMSRCAKCPTLPWLVIQMTFIVCVILLVIFILVRDDRKTKGRARTLSDIVLARLKIVIGFYQVTAGTLDAFSYVQWPEALLQLSNYAKFVQLNLVQIAPLHCFKDSFKMNAYVGLLITVALNVGVIVLAFAYFQIRKLLIKRTKDIAGEEKAVAISLCKEHCYRSAFLVMFITFPEVSSRILRMLPPACHEICQDVEMKNCTYYLKMDYSLKCFEKTYNKYVTAAYVGSSYPVLFPLFIVIVLYVLYYRPQIKNRGQNLQPKRYEIVEGMRFIYENYNERCWYWEIVETIRKLILTSGLSLIGAEGRTYIGMAAMASGFYAVAHAQARPIPDTFEHLLQLASLVATFFNLSVGVLLRIPSEMVNYSIEKDKDSVGVTVLLVTANVMVTGLLVIRYLVSLGNSLYGVYKNPLCNWECCLSVILSAQDAGTNREGMSEDVADLNTKRTQAEGDTSAASAMTSTVRTLENDGQEDMAEVSHGELEDIEDIPITTFPNDGNQPPGGTQSSGAIETPGEGAPNSVKETQSGAVEEGKMDGSSVDTKESSDGSGVWSKTQRSEPCKFPEVKFRKGNKETTADHSMAATNEALVSGDMSNGKEAILLDILVPTGAESETKKREGVPKADPDLGRANQAMDADDIHETGF